MKYRRFRIPLVLSDVDLAAITSATSPAAVRRDVAAFVRECLDGCALQVLAARREAADEAAETTDGAGRRAAPADA